MQQTYKGSCHCGAIRYEVDLDLAQGTGKCNCTFCTKSRAWSAFARPAQFRLLAGKDKARGYRKHPQAPTNYFCPECGTLTYAQGKADYMGGEFVGIFLSSLDDVEPQELIDAPVRYSDGRNNNWQNPPAETRHL